MSALVTLASHTGRLEMPNTVMRTESLRLQQAWDQLPSIHSRYIHSYEFLPRSFNASDQKRAGVIAWEGYSCSRLLYLNVGLHCSNPTALIIESSFLTRNAPFRTISSSPT